MEKDSNIVIFDELKDEKENNKNPLSYYLFNEILENSTKTVSGKSFIPIIDTSDYESVVTHDPDHVIMVIPLNLIEEIEEITPSYWESYLYWQYPKIKININSSGLVKIVNRMFQWLVRMKKIPFVVIAGFKEDENRTGLSKIDIVSCLANNGIPDNRIFFVDDSQHEKDILIIKDLVRVVKTSLPDI